MAGLVHQRKTDPATTWSPKWSQDTSDQRFTDSQIISNSIILLTGIDIGGTTIPAGSTIQLSYAAVNRDPERFPNPDRFDPARWDTQHLSFNTGLHYCFGAPWPGSKGLSP